MHTQQHESKEELAAANLKALFENRYPGRGIVMGRSESGSIVQVYWIMGRSEGSRARVFKKDGNRVFTEQTDTSKGGDPNLIVYNAMDSVLGQHVVSNGRQTDDVIAEITPGGDGFASFEQGLSLRTYEPDAPNYTSRISGIVTTRFGGEMPAFYLSAIRKTSVDDKPERLFYSYEGEEILPGFGRMITTYAGDGNPLPQFDGEPRLVPLQGDIIEIQDAFWFALNEANRVSIAVKVIDCTTGKKEIVIRNRVKN